MTIGDIPSISSMNYTNTAYAGDMLISNGSASGWGSITPFTTADTVTLPWTLVNPGAQVPTFYKENIVAEKVTTRLVRVVIVDNNENIPLEQRVVYGGEEKFTDLNDQELFFELDIKGLMKAHNEKRVKTVDKTVKERTEYLEPAKIRDLKMVVVNIATF